MPSAAAVRRCRRWSSPIAVTRADGSRSQLAPLAGERPVVVALPRGGVPVAFEIARALDAPLDILAVRKIGAPANPEFAVGALAEDGTAGRQRAPSRDGSA